jgi:hypothetical protein
MNMIYLIDLKLFIRIPRQVCQKFVTNLFTAELT